MTGAAAAAPARRRGMRVPLPLVVGGALVALHVLVAVLGPHLAPFAPDQFSAGQPQSPASLAHPFGTDSLGRDVLRDLCESRAPVPRSVWRRCLVCLAGV